MVEAIVFVQAEVGESSAVARAVAELGGVTAADVVTVKMPTSEPC